jgi:hypothetical protein
MDAIEREIQAAHRKMLERHAQEIRDFKRTVEKILQGTTARYSTHGSCESLWKNAT